MVEMEGKNFNKEDRQVTLLNFARFFYISEKREKESNQGWAIFKNDVTFYLKCHY